MIDDRILLQVEEGIAQLRLNRPDKLNALDRPMIDALLTVGDRLRKEPGLRAVVLAGVGRAFCAGLDLAEMTALAQSDPAALQELMARGEGDTNAFQQVSLQWRDLPVPVIAAVHGVCYGGGLQIASGADIRIVAPDARIAILETNWGIVPDMGGYVLWPCLMRDDVLRELIYTAREISGEEAASVGLCTHVATDPLEEANLLAIEIAGRSPDAIAAAKRLANLAAQGSSRAEMLVAESAEQAKLIGSANQREAVSARMSGRLPSFTTD